MGFGTGTDGHRRVFNMRIIMIACRKASTRMRSLGDGMRMLNASEVTTYFCILNQPLAF
jgi:hypothetical protein